MLRRGGVPRCYLLALASASSLDQHTNNVSIFNLVEQVNIPPGAPPFPGGFMPLEVHAYFALAPHELGQSFEVRHVLRAETGLETIGEPITYRSTTPRYRTRVLGVPRPPVPGDYQLLLEWRAAAGEPWQRDPARWPLTLVEPEARPTVTH